MERGLTKIATRGAASYTINTSSTFAYQGIPKHLHNPTKTNSRMGASL
jgi:hypothetical protein